jgi:hypothetical protein
VGTTLNNLNRPTRAVVSLAINHSHSPRWSTCRFQSSFPGAGVLTAALACSQQQPQEKGSDGTCMACLAGACLCCCCEGELRCSFPFSSCALTTFVTLFGRALLLTGASVLGCWVVAPDINDSVNAPMIHDLFFTNARMPWDMRSHLFTEANPDCLPEQKDRSRSRNRAAGCGYRLGGDQV